MEKYIEEIIEIVLDNVSCEHTVEGYLTGSHQDITYSLDNEKEVIKKCVKAIPAYPMKFILKVDNEFVEEKTFEMVKIVSSGEILDSMSFIRKLINEISEKINLKGD